MKIKYHQDWQQEHRSLVSLTMPDGTTGYITLIRHLELKEALRTLAAGVLIFAVCLFLFFVAGVM